MSAQTLTQNAHALHAEHTHEQFLKAFMFEVLNTYAQAPWINLFEIFRTNNSSFYKMEQLVLSFVKDLGSSKFVSSKRLHFLSDLFFWEYKQYSKDVFFKISYLNMFK